MLSLLRVLVGELKPHSHMEHQKKKKRVMSLSLIPGLTEDYSPGDSLLVVPEGEGRDWEVGLYIISG